MKPNNYSTQRMKSPVIITLCSLFIIATFQVQAQDLEKDIKGKWLMVSSGDKFLGGHILFKDGGTYQFYKKWPDGTGAEISGGYELDSNSSPTRLKICLGDCGAAGSEWTTNFGIVRFTEANQLEMYLSSTGSYPDNFPEDLNAKGMYLFKAEN